MTPEQFLSSQVGNCPNRDEEALLSAIGPTDAAFWDATMAHLQKVVSQAATPQRSADPSSTEVGGLLPCYCNLRYSKPSSKKKRKPFGWSPRQSRSDLRGSLSSLAPSTHTRWTVGPNARAVSKALVPAVLGTIKANDLLSLDTAARY